ncbi:MAG: HAMP domain-containing protein [Proteobacteria bacterium]|nr:HAMP domain-containing protein [Pseudomonadota bacterium]
MMRVLDTLVGRTIFVSLIAISLMHLVSLWGYEGALNRELLMADEARLADHMVSIRESLRMVPAPERDAAAHRLSSGPVEVHWSPTERAVAGGTGAAQWAGLPSRVIRQVSGMKPDDVIVGTSGNEGGDPHVALISLRLPDDSWVNVSLFAYNHSHAVGGHGYLVSTSLMALGVVLLSVLIAGWLTRPIRKMAQAVRELKPGADASSLPAQGPREVRELALAFNDMQTRITRLIDERTRALAAVSHDLRTPLTRLRLRIEDLGNPEATAAIATDIGELEQMIEATLSYLRGEEKSEPVRAIDLAALLQTVADEGTDLGGDVGYAGPRSLAVQGRHIALKRALANLVLNALKYGHRARVSLTTEHEWAVVRVDDDGPGIPADKLESVFEPFVRLESSRNRETGGVGLGLTIARAAIRADGGELTLANRPEGGLSVTARLPRTIGQAG